MSYKQKYWLQEILGYLVSVGVPITTTLIVFPDSISTSTSTTTSLSMSFILTMIVSLAAFKKQLAKVFNNSPSIVTWIVIFVITVVLKKFADEMYIISLTGVVSNMVSTPLFAMASKNKKKMDLLQEELLKNEINKQANNG